MSSIRSLKEEIKAKLFQLIFRDSIRQNRINLIYWKRKHTNNVGDLLSLVVYRYMLDYFHLKPGAKTKKTIRLLGVGSIIHTIKEDAVIWGSGVKCIDSMKDFDRNLKLDIRCVRGPETRGVIMSLGFDCPSVYGDPALLLPLFYKPRLKAGRDKVIVIPHFTKENEFTVLPPDCELLSTITNDWRRFIDKICAAKFVISSSLHGIIIAEAYGIPAILLDKGDPAGMFKYDDYYRSTGRISYKIANDVNEALLSGPEILPDISLLQENLLGSFPKDLWG